jgi:hypothetical protein
MFAVRHALLISVAFGGQFDGCPQKAVFQPDLILKETQVRKMHQLGVVDE